MKRLKFRHGLENCDQLASSIFMPRLHRRCHIFIVHVLSILKDELGCIESLRWIPCMRTLPQFESVVSQGYCIFFFYNSQGYCIIKQKPYYDALSAGFFCLRLVHHNWLFLITQTFSLSRIMNLALEFTRSCSASVSLFQWQTGDSLQDSRWKLSKRILLVMQKALLLTLTSVHVLMVVPSHALKHIPLFRLINGPYFL